MLMTMRGIVRNDYNTTVIVQGLEREREREREREKERENER